MGRLTPPTSCLRHFDYLRKPGLDKCQKRETYDNGIQRNIAYFYKFTTYHRYLHTILITGTLLSTACIQDIYACGAHKRKTLSFQDY